MKETFFYNRIKDLLHRRFVPVIVYILLLFAATVNVSIHGGTISYVFFYGMVLYLPLSLLYILYIIMALKIYQEIDARLIQKHTAEKYSFVIENSGILPIANVTFFYDKNITVFPEDFTEAPYRLLPFEKITTETEMLCRYAGSYDAGIEGYTVSDVFGIIRISRHIKVPVRVYVLPVINEVSDELVERLINEDRNGNLFSLNAPENYLGNEIRKYSEGDRLNTVHWKHYAKTGEMFVRLPETQQSEMITLVLITEAMDGSLDSIRCRDRFLEYLVSVAQYFGMRQKPLMVVYYDHAVKKFLIDSPESFHKFYTECIIAIGGKSAAGYEDLLMNEVRGKTGNVLIFKEKDYDSKQ